MNGRLITGFLVLSAAAVLASDGVTGDFSRYSIILDKKPFGLPPSQSAAQSDAVVAPQDSFATYVRLSAMMQEEGGGVRVGFVDKKQKDKVYMLMVGETADEYEVLEADVKSELAKIRKGQEEQWLSMKTAGAVPPPNGGTSKSLAPAPAAVQVADVRPTPQAGLLAGLRRQSRYAAIRRAEIESEKKAETAKRLGVFREPPAADTDEDEDEDEDEAAPANPAQVTVVDEEEDEDDEDDGVEVVISTPAASDDEEDEDEDEDEDEAIREAEIQSHLQNYQKELIRQGLPPLPIPLTAKTDAELVKEGTLAPLPAATADDDDDE